MTTLEPYLTPDDLATLRDFHISLDDPRHVPAESDGDQRERIREAARQMIAEQWAQDAVERFQQRRLGGIVTICYAALMLAGALFVTWGTIR